MRIYRQVKTNQQNKNRLNSKITKNQHERNDLCADFKHKTWSTKTRISIHVFKNIYFIYFN